jgi:hypothetical protein
MNLSTRASIDVPKPVEEVFSVACEGMPRFLHAVGPIPGIVGAEIEGGGVLESGADRKVHMSDGSVIEERVLDYERPRVHRYVWRNSPPPPFSWFVKTGEANWTFAASGAGTAITWTYTFELTSAALSPLAALVIVFFRRWMMQGLSQLRTVMAG